MIFKTAKVQLYKLQYGPSPLQECFSLSAVGASDVKVQILPMLTPASETWGGHDGLGVRVSNCGIKSLINGPQPPQEDSLSP